MVSSSSVAAVVLGSAALHAAWNVALRRGADRRAGTAWLALTAGGISAMVLPFLPAPASASWPNIGISGLLHVVYYILVAEAYTHGGIALAYPLMRGIAPMLATLAGWALLGEALPALAWAGILSICAGVVLLARRRGEASERKAIGFALANAAVIAAYTLNDAIGGRASASPVAYTLWMEVVSAPFAVAWLWRGRLSAFPNRAALLRAGGGAACSLATYALAVWAMTQAPVAIVAALRETSMLFALMLARVFLHERPGWRGWAAAAVIAGGAALLRLA
jgi:drug/metabolite transporter (DMT)-like permease